MIRNNSRTNQSSMQRIGMLIVSVALIAVTLQYTGPLGWKVILPLIAIYPGIAAFTGWDPIKALMAAAARYMGAGRKTPVHQN